MPSNPWTNSGAQGLLKIEAEPDQRKVPFLLPTRLGRANGEATTVGHRRRGQVKNVMWRHRPKGRAKLRVK